MYEITILDKETKKEFIRLLNSPYKLRILKIKISYSKRLVIKKVVNIYE